MKTGVLWLLKDGKLYLLILSGLGQTTEPRSEEFPKHLLQYCVMKAGQGPGSVLGSSHTKMKKIQTMSCLKAVPLETKATAGTINQQQDGILLSFSIPHALK